MQTIAIISDLHDWHSDQIESFLKKINLKLLKLLFKNLNLASKKIKFFLRIINYSIN